MTAGLHATLANNMLDEITTRAGGSAVLTIYDGVRPSTGGTATTVLAQLTCNATFAPAASGATLTLNAITDDSSANATGTATWFRLASSGGNLVMDGSVGATGSGADLELSTTSIVAGAVVQITAATITVAGV